MVQGLTPSIAQEKGSEPRSRDSGIIASAGSAIIIAKKHAVQACCTHASARLVLLRNEGDPKLELYFKNLVALRKKIPMPP